MNIRKSRSFLLIIVISCLSIATVSAANTSKSSLPETAVNSFYKYHFAHDMAFTPDAVKARSAWMTPELLEACRVYFDIPEDPEEPPFIEGDAFTGSQEYPSHFSVGSATISERSARVPITFNWKEDGHSTEGTVVLKKVQEKWLIDDVEFPDQESIRQLLKEASAPPKQ